MSEVLSQGVLLYAQCTLTVECISVVSSDIDEVKPDLYYEKSLRHALRQLCDRGNPCCSLSEAVATAHRKS